jgi:hypothetical protein
MLIFLIGMTVLQIHVEVKTSYTSNRFSLLYVNYLVKKVMFIMFIFLSWN